ncbi:kinase-like domain-containing protein [Mycena vulgaris]|nr:kinase-like domain-containing protein [Mycena vulgaris]
MSPSNSLPDLTGLLVDEGRLRLLQALGAGSYGVVYKAIDTNSPSDAPIYYAVKCLGSGSRLDKREVELHTVCSPHPSITTLYRQFYTRGYLCIVLELSTSDLWGAIDDGVFHKNNTLVKKAFLQILDAVRFCHQRGVHHRDLKPENVLCSADGSNIRVADFGMAVDDELPSSSAGGTTSYMTPESVTLGRGTETYEPAQSDTWASCIILLNMMTGGFPWRKAVDSDKGWDAFLTDDNYLRRKFPISDPLNDLLERCFRPVAATRPTLLQLRFEIANMKDLFKVATTENVTAPEFLSLPLLLVPSAPPTPGASFSFHPSDYPSPATSNATSISIELNPVRLSELAAACAPKPLVTPIVCTPAPKDRAPSPSAELSPVGQEILARLRARPPMPHGWPSIDLARKFPITLPPPAPKKPSRNPLRRLCHWIKYTRRGYS